MELTLELIFIFMILGAGVGFLAGLLGIGGGAYIVPILTIIFTSFSVSPEHSIKLALGTSMACIVFTTLSSMIAQQKRKGILWDIVKIMLPGVTIGVFISTFIASRTNPFYLGIIFTIFMGYISYSMFTNKKPKSSRTILPTKWLIAGSSGIGLVSGLVSIAGGSLIVPFLIWQNINIKKAIGTSSAVGFFLTIVGAIGYVINGLSLDTSLKLQYSVGYVYLPALFFISITSFLFAPIGVRFVYIFPVSVIKKIFGILALALSLRMLYVILNNHSF